MISQLVIGAITLPFWILYRLTRWIPCVGQITQVIYMFVEFMRIYATFPWLIGSKDRITSILQALDDNYYEAVEVERSSFNIPTTREVMDRIIHHKRVARYFGYKI